MCVFKLSKYVEPANDERTGCRLQGEILWLKTTKHIWHRDTLCHAVADAPAVLHSAQDCFCRLMKLISAWLCQRAAFLKSFSAAAGHFCASLWVRGSVCMCDSCMHPCMLKFICANYKWTHKSETVCVDHCVQWHCIVSFMCSCLHACKCVNMCILLPVNSTRA